MPIEDQVFQMSFLARLHSHIHHIQDIILLMHHVQCITCCPLSRPFDFIAPIGPIPTLRFSIQFLIFFGPFFHFIFHRLSIIFCERCWQFIQLWSFYRLNCSLSFDLEKKHEKYENNIKQWSIIFWGLGWEIHIFVAFYLSLFLLGIYQISPLKITRMIELF